MHPYSIDTNERTTIIATLAIISCFLTILLDRLLNQVHISIPVYIESPTPLVVFGIIWFLFDKYSWKWGGLIKLFIRTPNLNGTWEGEYQSSYTKPDCPDEFTKGKVKMTIEQSWTKIRICSINGNDVSSSCSKLAGIFVEDNNGIMLKYEFENDSKNFITTMHRHTGFTILKFDSALNTLKGDYYTDRDRLTFGNLKYKRK